MGNEEIDSEKYLLQKKTENVIYNEDIKSISNNTEGCQKDSVRCGITSCRPDWLQIFASKKCYTCVYSVVLVISAIKTAYFTGTLSTMEKNFKMSSTMLASLSSAFAVGSLIAYFFIVYFIDKGNKIRWVSSSLLIIGISCVIKIIPIFPHFFDNTGNLQQNFDPNKMCDEVQGDLITGNIAFYFFFAGQIITGIGGVILKTSGFIYLDKNTRKNTFPLLFSIIESVESLGSSIGYMMASYFLKIYVYPNQVPNFTHKDSRWIGAWWLGWIPIAIAYFICSAIFILFPRTLPRAAMREEISQHKQKNSSISVADFVASFKRIVKNKIVVLDILNNTTLQIAFAGYGIFLPKYLEKQYGLTASNSSLFLGIAKVGEKPIGILTSGLILSKFKPTPRTIMKMSVVMRFVSVAVIISFIFISCPEQKMEGNLNDDNSLNLTTQCNINHKCSENMKYSPVCNEQHKLLFYSSCHAGCDTKPLLKNQTIYSNCSCVPNYGSVVKGSCTTNCMSAIVTFLVVKGIYNIASIPVRSTKKILRFRFVDDEDKSLYFGIRKILPSILSLVSPIVCGSLIDRACVIFEKTCNRKGNCLMYNLTKWRYLLNSFTASFLLLCAITEVLIWYHVKDLKMYDEDFKNNALNLNEEIKNENKTLIKK